MTANSISLTDMIHIIKARGFANTEEAAKYLGLSIHYIRRLSRNNILNSYKPSGKCIYFKVEDLDNYLLNNQRLGKDILSLKSAKYLFNKK